MRRMILETNSWRAGILLGRGLDFRELPLVGPRSGKEFSLGGVAGCFDAVFGVPGMDLGFRPSSCWPIDRPHL
jgi:hypothetical protein